MKINLLNSPFSTGKALLLNGMRIFFFLFFSAAFCFNPIQGISQNTKIKFGSDKTLSVDEIFEEIEEQTSYRFIYPADLFEDLPQVEVRKGEIDLDLLLMKSFDQSQFDFQLDDTNNIVINRNPTTLLTVQQHMISGTVTDENGVPLPAVNITVEGTSKGTTSDFDGNYEIEVEKGQKIKFSSIGFEDHTVEVGDDTTVNIAMKEGSALDEVVVVGYGTQKRENLTGAVEQITVKDLSSHPITDAAGALQGKIPGLNVRINNGDPRGEPDLNIRGFNSLNGGNPLVLIDGVEGNISNLNPDDIESVTVLKDAASAAIYGARGSNGVILIGTKTGESGDIRVEYSNNFAWTTPTSRTDYISDPYLFGKTVDAAINGYNGSSYTQYDSDMDWKTIEMVSKGEIDPFHQLQADGTYKFFYNTNWYDYYYKDYQASQNHNISISGGNEKLTGRLSARLHEREDINNINTGRINRYNIKNNLSFKPTEWLELSNTTTVHRKYDKEYGGYRNGFGGIWSTSSWYNQFPFLPNFIDGVPANIGRPGEDDQGGGPAMEAGNNWKSSNEEELLNTFRVLFKPLKNLEVNFDYSKKVRNISRTTRLTPFEYITGHDLKLITDGENQLEEWRWKRYYNALNVFATYKQNIGGFHHFKIMAGYNQEDYDRDRVKAQQGGLIVREKANLAFGIDPQVADGSTETWAIEGYFARFNYDYKEKYLLEINSRYDGSSRFPSSNRWGFFPSLSVGWQLNKESFWEPVRDVVNTMKIRASYGELGNQRVGVSTFEETMSVGQSNWFENGKPIKYVGTPAPLPKNIGWEKTTSYNIGTDLQLLDRNLEVSFDWYDKRVENMYLPGSPLPAVFGATVPKENHAALKNRGFELNLKYQNSFEVADSPLNLSAAFNISNFKGYITKYENPNGVMSDFWEGQRLGQIWGYHVDGQFQSDEEARKYQESFDNPSQDLKEVYDFILNVSQNSDWNRLRAGDVKYVDSNGDGKIDNGSYTLEDHGDLQQIGNAMPQYPFGFHLSADWKGVDFSLDGTGVIKQHWYPYSALFWGPYYRPFDSFIRKDLVENAWTPENPGKYPRIDRGYTALGSRSLGQVNDYYLQNIGFLRIKNITIGYTLPQELTQKIKIERFRIYFSGENLFTWRFHDFTKYFDPEQTGNAVNNSDAGSAVKRSDVLDYPMGKTYSFGINLTI